MEALRALLGSGQRHVGDGARDVSVAVVERVDRDEPEMRDGRLDHRVAVVGRVETVEEGLHLRVEAWRGRRFGVDALAIDGTGDDLHRTAVVVAPPDDADPADAVVAGLEKACQPNRRGAVSVA